MSLTLDHATLGRQAPQAAGPAQFPPAQALPVVVRRPNPFWLFLRTGMQASVLVSVVGFLTMFVAERAASYPWKPSTMLGAYGGNLEYAHITTGLEAKRAQVAMEQQELARAQEEIVVVQATNERLTQAYAALFQRGTAMAQTWAQGAMQTLQQSTQAKMLAMQGQMENAALRDKIAFYCNGLAILIPELQRKCDEIRQSARDERDAMEAEIVNGFRRQSRIIALSLRDWAVNLPDPAELLVQQAAAVSQVLGPAPRPAPPASPIYPRGQDMPAMPANAKL